VSVSSDDKVCFNRYFTMGLGSWLRLDAEQPEGREIW